jgi:hypothetical protein
MGYDLLKLVADVRVDVLQDVVHRNDENGWWVGLMPESIELRICR